MSSLSYIDVLDSEKVGADTVSLSLSNSDGRFYDAWYPQEGDVLECGIGWRDDHGRHHTWMWGQFSIDEVRFAFNPDRVSIGANAKPAVRGQIDNEESATYEHTSFVTLAQDIAHKVGVQALISRRLVMSRMQGFSSAMKARPPCLAGSRKRIAFPSHSKGINWWWVS